MERRGCGFRNSTTDSRAAGDAASAVGGKAKAGQVVSSSQASVGPEDPQFWAKVGPVMFHGLQVMAQRGMSSSVITAAAALSWPDFSGDPLLFPSFKTRWEKVEKGAAVQLEDHQLCEVFKLHVPPAMAAQMAYFTSMEQVWDYMSVAVEKPLEVLVRCKETVEGYGQVRNGDSGGLERRYRELERFAEEVKMLGALKYLATAELVEAVLKAVPALERTEWVKRSAAAVERPLQFFQFVKERLGEGVCRPGLPPDPKKKQSGEAPVVAAAAVSAVCGPCDATSVYSEKVHRPVTCTFFMTSTPGWRYAKCMAADICLVCLVPGHGAAVAAADGLRDCPVSPGTSKCRTCGNRHHLEVSCKSPFEESRERSSATAAVNVAASLGNRPVQVLAQRVQVGGCSEDFIAFWDSGSQVTMLTHSRAAACGLRSEEAAPLQVQGFNGESTPLGRGYHVPLVTKDGELCTIFAYGVDNITTDLTSCLDREAAAAFPDVPWEDVKGVQGKVEMLMGYDNAGIFPLERERKGQLALWSSRLGTGWMIAGRADPECQCNKCECTVAISNNLTASCFQPLDFIRAEAMGTDTPARCPTCRSCRECQFRADSISFKENKEYEVIVAGLKLDVEKKKWTASYPFCVSPWTLIDNYNQARGCMQAQEKRLVRTKRLAEFNEQFYQTVERGVFRKLTREEMADYKGPVNYVTMVEALKNGPHATTPLRICMNSAMKQPQPSGRSLNDCLMKGPSALADLFTTTLGMREFRYALTKDLSKFYQRVDVDELAQHVRRIVWRGGDLQRDPDVYVTTTVNFGDKPAGCIAIVAARETARRFGGGKETAAWFLENRTYVDDATAGADTMEELQQLSREMEEIAACGGFTFKETLMSGDTVEDHACPKKVLGLFWETDRDML